MPTPLVLRHLASASPSSSSSWRPVSFSSEEGSSVHTCKEENSQQGILIAPQQQEAALSIQG